MSLQTLIDYPSHLLEKGVYKNFKYIVAHNGLGFRCGYVKLDWGHPWYRSDDVDDCICHGGITYSDDDTIAGWWIGFDCCHYTDMIDFDLPGEHKILKDIMGGQGRSIKTTEFVRQQCFLLIEQALLKINN